MKKLVMLVLMLSPGLAAFGQSDGLGYSSSVDAAELPGDPHPVAGAIERPVERRANRPFRSVALEFKAGLAGIGFDLATPVASFANLRGGAQFFDHSLNPNANGLHSIGELTLQNVQVSLDLFPFKGSSFHLSPGVTVHNDNHLFSSIFVPPGDSFSLGDANYVSDPQNPISGYSRFKLGNSTAPRITAGFGNMLPKKGYKFSVPVEVGIQYISSPTLDLHLSGNACNAMGCGNINSSDGPQNLANEVQILNQDIATLRFYPIFSIGLSYKIGR